MAIYEDETKKNVKPAGAIPLEYGLYQPGFPERPPVNIAMATPSLSKFTPTLGTAPAIPTYDAERQKLMSMAISRLGELQKEALNPDYYAGRRRAVVGEMGTWLSALGSLMQPTAHEAGARTQLSWQLAPYQAMQAYAPVGSYLASTMQMLQTAKRTLPGGAAGAIDTFLELLKGELEPLMQAQTQPMQPVTPQSSGVGAIPSQVESTIPEKKRFDFNQYLWELLQNEMPTFQP